MTTRKENLPDKNRQSLRNEDPITGETGAHPVGTGVGAALGGAAVGAAAGSFGGPVGTIAGTIIGGIAGAMAGKAVAEGANPTIEEAFWRDSYPTRPYYRKEHTFERYEPAYRFGWENYDANARSWEAREPELKKKWTENRWENEGGSPILSWEEARLAAKDAFERVTTRNANITDEDCDQGGQRHLQ